MDGFAGFEELRYDLMIRLRETKKEAPNSNWNNEKNKSNKIKMQICTLKIIRR